MALCIYLKCNPFKREARNRTKECVFKRTYVSYFTCFWLVCRNKLKQYIHTTPRTKWPKASGSASPSNDPFFFFFFFTVSKVSGTQWQGEECSASIQSFSCTSEPWRKRRWRERKKNKGRWRRNGELDVWEGCRTKSAELDCILSGSVPYKSLPSLKGLHGRWIKPNLEGITRGGKA